jgi:hypothetical protein
MDYGVCDICGTAIASRSAFVNTGPTDWHDPDKPKRRSWVAADTDIHGWTPFVLTHPVCFANEEGVEALVALVEDSDRRMQRQLRDRG